MIPGGKSVVTELVILSVVVTLTVAARTASKMIRRLGSFQSVGSSKPTRSLDYLRLFQSDDYIMFFNFGLFVTVIYSIWVQVLWGNNYITAADIVGWTPEDFHLAIMGSIFGIVMEICKVTCVWGCKACLLILYFSMTKCVATQDDMLTTSRMLRKGVEKYHTAVIAVSVYVAVGYIVVMTFLVGVWCRPFHLYYDTIPVPAANEQCMTYRNHMILDACLNITGDAAMLCLPIPLLISAKLPFGRKCALIGVFSLGGLVILCAILNRITNFDAPMGSLIYLNWYAGEISTAMIVANVPHLWPLISRTFKLGSFAENSANLFTTDNRSSFTMQNIRKGNNFNLVGSEERITGNAQGLDHSENKLDLTGGKGFSESNIFSGGWDDDEPDSDATTRRIVKTVAVTQYSGAV